MDMVYTALTKKAMKIAIEAHAGQLDKGGFPYIFHPMYLAMQMNDEASVCAALLHDVVEDTTITFEQLENEGFGEDIISVLRLLTHDKSVAYSEYIDNIAADPVARAIKLADLRHNSDITRIATPTEHDIERAERYRRYINYLEEIV